MVNAAHFGFVAPFIVELYFQGWNVRCTCALFKPHVYPCDETTSSEVLSQEASKLSLICVDVINIKDILNIHILFKQPKIGLP